MCFGDGGAAQARTDALAEKYQMQLEELQRQARIRQGQEKIDTIFDGKRSVTGTKTVQKKSSIPAGASALPDGLGWKNNPKGGYDLIAPDGSVIQTFTNPGDALGHDYTYNVTEKVYGPRSGGFDDAYYDGFKKNYIDYYTPQLDKQYGDALDSMTAALAGQGILESGVGAKRLADVNERYADQRTQVQSQATDAANALRKNVEGTKTNLYSINQAAADPQSISARAIGEATALQAPQAYSPLGQMFADILQPIGAMVSASQNSPGPAYTRRGGTSYAPTTGAGSSKIIG